MSRFVQPISNTCTLNYLITTKAYETQAVNALIHDYVYQLEAEDFTSRV